MATSSPNVPKVVHVGPGLAVRGGVSAVERLIIDSISHQVQVEHVATMEGGGILRRIRVFGAALWRIHSILRDQSPCIFHVHFASRGSTLRKCIVALMVLRQPACSSCTPTAAASTTSSRTCRNRFRTGLPGSSAARTVSWSCPLSGRSSTLLSSRCAATASGSWSTPRTHRARCPIGAVATACNFSSSVASMTPRGRSSSWTLIERCRYVPGGSPHRVRRGRTGRGIAAACR